MMNLFKVSCLLLSFKAFATQIIQIDYVKADHLWRAKIAQSIMEDSYNLPSIFFEKKNVEDCIKRNEESALIHLCIKNNGELVAKNINNDFFKRSLSFFYLYN